MSIRAEIAITKRENRGDANVSFAWSIKEKRVGNVGRAEYQRHRQQKPYSSNWTQVLGHAHHPKDPLAPFEYRPALIKTRHNPIADASGLDCSES